MGQFFDAKDKTFVITGGASGLGAEYAQAFLQKGAKAVAILDISEETGKLTASRLNKLYNEKVVFVKCDVSKEEDIKNAFDVVVAQFKQIDVLINNAGIMNDAPNMWRTACDVNWQGVVSFTLKALKHMNKKEGGAGGTIINIASTAGLTVFPFLPIYGGSKLAVVHFGQSLGTDPFYENSGIRVLTMCPGPTDTPLLHNLETRSYDPNLGKIFADAVGSSDVEYQKVESAVAALVHMFENGASGSTWLTVENRPAKDITPVINRIFKILSDEINMPSV
ncbi:unnamed protein product [Arctia plantaginis]|uniref:Alcohol dehydrogenase n=1 Tax=Arctia plantaginis TaxID=874455 RepID=A0A8S1B6M5_ARCPL|nr:unnamed protein product [Arctia plantaginis]CAB3253679.1 unnamed protein product [Arctia plantaginis]